MGLYIKQYIGKTGWESDCYIVSDQEINNNCFIVDPGSEDVSEYVDYIESHELIPTYMFITHRHYDHFAGGNKLRNKYPQIKVICSKGCDEAIQNPRLNCSIFMDNHKTVILKAADETFNGKYSKEWNGHIIELIPTPGHTVDSISIVIEKNIFTGDALLSDFPTVTKLPSGNKEQQRETEQFFRSLHGYMAWPGHGEAFVID